MCMDLGIGIAQSKNGSLTNTDIPAAFVNLSLGDAAKNLTTAPISGEKPYDAVTLIIDNTIDMMDNIDVDFSDYIKTTAIDGSAFRNGTVGYGTSPVIYNNSTLRLTNQYGSYRNNVRYRATVIGNTLYSDKMKVSNNPSLGNSY